MLSVSRFTLIDAKRRGANDSEKMLYLGQMNLRITLDTILEATSIIIIMPSEDVTFITSKISDANGKDDEKPTPVVATPGRHMLPKYPLK